MQGNTVVQCPALLLQHTRQHMFVMKSWQAANRGLNTDSNTMANSRPRPSNSNTGRDGGEGGNRHLTLSNDVHTDEHNFQLHV